MPEPPLNPQGLPHRLQLPRLVRQPEVAAIGDLEEGPDPALHSQPRHLNRVTRAEPPARGAGRLDVEELEPLQPLRVLDLPHQVAGIGDTRRPHVSHVVGRHDEGQVLPLGPLPPADIRCRRRRCLGVLGGRPAPLAAGVHVGLVVGADPEDVLVPLGGAREPLEADVSGPAVPDRKSVV